MSHLIFIQLIFMWKGITFRVKILLPMIDTVLFQLDLKFHEFLHLIENLNFLFPTMTIKLDEHALKYKNIKMHLKF